MTSTFRAVGGAFAQIFNHFLISILGNVVTIVTALPVILLIGLFSSAARSFGLIPIGLALFVAIMPFPGAAGMQFVAYQLAEGEIVYASDVVAGLRQYARQAIVPWLVSSFVAVVILANIGFYARMTGSHTGLSSAAGLPLTLIWTALLVAWIVLHLHIYPLIVRMDDSRVWLLYRNAFIVAMRRPGTSIVTCILWVLLLFLATATGLSTIVGLAFAAAIQQILARSVLPGLLKS